MRVCLYLNVYLSIELAIRIGVSSNSTESLISLGKTSKKKSSNKAKLVKKSRLIVSTRRALNLVSDTKVKCCQTFNIFEMCEIRIPIRIYC